MKNAIRWSCLLLLLTQVSYAQQPVLPWLQQQLETYRNQVVQEKLFVHTDRSFYLSGERIWFRMYYVDGMVHRPLDVSKVAYLDVLDKDQKAVAQAKVALDSSRGMGSVYLPTSLLSGTYTVRAYTQWMKSTSREFLFEKPITIVNSFRRLDLPLLPDSLAYDAQLFPEGGHLVNGLPAKVAFKLVDTKTGRGIDCRGALLGAANDTLARFSSVKFGLGTFAFTPSIGTRYRVVFVDRKGHSISRPLPAIDETGYSMQVTDTGDGTLQVIVQANQAAATVYLIGHTRQVVNVAEGQTMAGNKALFSVPKSKLGEGISHLTLFDAAGKPVCERLVARRPQASMTLQVTPGKDRYATRDNVVMGLTASSPTGSPLPANASVSVYKVDSLQSEEGLAIGDYLWLTSDLRGSVESPQYYLNQTGPEADAALDNLLLTHGWRRFRWDDVLNPRPADAVQPPEHKGHVVLGRVTDAGTGAPARDVPTFLAIPGRSIRLYSSRSDNRGLVRFELPEFYGTHDLVLQTSAGDSLHRVDILNPYTETGTSTVMPAPDLNKTVNEPLQARSLAMQVQNSYFNAYANPALRSDTDSSMFYNKPDERYYLDTYTRFTVLEEVLSEYVPGVLVRRQNGHFVLRVSNMPYRMPFNDDPLILLDGVPVYDVDRIMAFSPLKIKSLDVVTRRYMLGYANLPGIISFKTYKADLAGFQLDPHAVVLEYEGLQARREFYAPSYATPGQLASRLPDFRNLLYWNPSVSTNQQGKANLSFYTSDQEGRYLIVVQAITPDGRFATSHQTISVQGALK
ncbi:hypothetical protein [Fibrella forsythiae]|uniref:Macroglobulin domain-containing protein n=1 Tax=Fibrella forsythiae TaxID=2817061 RepID=A0ABS3JCR9_9BACT|nr:hypothetical protein [Fibrella forsythiae]MBO0947800.1 hypothetical protein [Fibrella forsythiae]